MEKKLKTKMLLCHNAASGFNNERKTELYLKILREHYNLEIIAIEDLSRERVQHDDFEVVIAAGGDGTVNAVAQFLVGSEKKLAILPLGTFNHFAKQMNIPLDPAAAARVIIGARYQEVDVAEVNGFYFLNFLFLGLYSKVLERRQKLSKRGINKWLAQLYFIFLEFLKNEKMELVLYTEKKNLTRSVSMLFIGNNHYDIDGWDFLRKKTSIHSANLLIGLIPRLSRLKLLLLGSAFFTGRLPEEKSLDVIGLEKIIIKSAKQYIKCGVDGEIIQFTNTLKIKSVPKSLKVICPEDL